MACCRGKSTILALVDSEARLQVRPVLVILFDLLPQTGEWQMRSLQEVLVNLILDELVESVANVLSARILNIFASVGLETLFLVSFFVLEGFERIVVFGVLARGFAFVQGEGPGTSIGIIPIIKFVGVDELAIVPILAVCLHELGREIALQGLVVG